jgi:prevent-host-death family protein
MAGTKKRKGRGRRGSTSRRDAGSGPGSPRSIGAAALKASLLRILREVAEGQEFVVTKRGRQVARLTPVRPEANRPLLGRLKGFMRITGDIVNTDWSSEWNATR